MGETVLSDAQVEALAHIHDAIAHDMQLETSLFFIQAELTRDQMVIRANEKYMRKQEELIFSQAERLLTQNHEVKRMEQDLARIQMQLESARGQIAYEKSRTIMSRLFGVLRHDAQ